MSLNDTEYHQIESTDSLSHACNELPHLNHRFPFSNEGPLSLRYQNTSSSAVPNLWNWSGHLSVDDFERLWTQFYPSNCL